MSNLLAGSEGRRVGARSRLARSRAGRQPTPRGVSLICLVVAGAQATWGLVIPVLPLYVDSLDAGPAALGSAVAAFGLGRVAVNIPCGALTRHVNLRVMLVTGAVVVAGATLATAFAGSVEQLFCARFVTGMGGGVVIVTGQTLLTGTDPARLGRTMGHLQAFQLAGGALGPAVGGFLVAAGLRVPFLACAGFLAVLAVAAAVLPLPQWRRHRAAALESAVPGASVWTRGLVAACVVGFVIFFVRFGGQQFMFPVLAYDRAGLSPAALGIAITASTVLNLLLVGWYGRLTDRAGARIVLVGATAAIAVTTLGFLGSDSVVLFLLALCATDVAMTFTGPSSGAFLAGAVPPDKRGTAVGIYRTTSDLAILSGPLALGWLIEHGLTDAAIGALAGFAALACLVFLLITRRTTGDVS